MVDFDVKIEGVGLQVRWAYQQGTKVLVDLHSHLSKEKH